MLILVSLLSLFTRGLNLGIDFEGGVAWEVPANTSVDRRPCSSRSTTTASAVSDAKIQTLRGTDGERIRASRSAHRPAPQRAGVRQTLADKAKVDIGEVAASTQIGPTWGERDHEEGRCDALVVFFVVPGALHHDPLRVADGRRRLAAMIHDVLISVGVYSLFGFEVTPATVIAFLTILGFSLYDTIVVFDKVHENTAPDRDGKRMTYGDIVNLSMNQVLMRSLNTSLAPCCRSSRCSWSARSCWERSRSKTSPSPSSSA